MVLATPTPALLPTPIAPATIKVSRSPCAVTDTLPPAVSTEWSETELPLATVAEVPVSSTCTAMDAATPTPLVLRPKVPAIEVMSSSDEAAMTMLPTVAVRSASAATEACVSRMITPTSRPMPTPALPLEAARPPAALNTVRVSSAVTLTSMPALRRASSPTRASVLMSNTFTLDEPPTALPLLAAATPAAKLVTATVPMMGSSSLLGKSEDSALTVMLPPASIWALLPTLASVSCPAITLTATAMPTPAPPLLVLSAAPPAMFCISL